MSTKLQNSRSPFYKESIVLIHLVLFLLHIPYSSSAAPIKNNKTILPQNNVLVIHGHVTDSDGTPVNDVTLKIRWLEGKWKTNIDGEFTLNANIGDTVIVDHTDYETTEFVMPEWQSATQGVKDVATDFILPLHFYLE
jgi:hypothetical protein